MTARARLPYMPVWSKALRGHAYNTVRRYWPALSAWYEWDDLMQEAFICFLVCKRRYQHKVDNPAWFMSLFKTAWRNRLIDLCVSIPRYSLSADTPVSPRAEADIVQELMEFLETLPAELRLVLTDLVRPTARYKFARKTVTRLKDRLLPA